MKIIKIIIIEFLKLEFQVKSVIIKANKAYLLVETNITSTLALATKSSN